MHLSEAKAAVMGAAAVVGGVIGQAFGGLDAAFQTLIIFMAIDYITGLVVAGVFGTSDKTESGASGKPGRLERTLPQGCDAACRFGCSSARYRA